MDKLIPLDMSVRTRQLAQKQKDQQKLIRQRWTDQRFAAQSDLWHARGPAFRDRHIASVYPDVRNHNAHMENEMVHATCSSPYKKARPMARPRKYRDAVGTHHPRHMCPSHEVITVSPAPVTSTTLHGSALTDS